MTASFSRSTYRPGIIRWSTGIRRFAPVIGWPGVIIVYRSGVVIIYRSTIIVRLNYDIVITRFIVVWPIISIPIVIWFDVVYYRFI